MTEKRAPYNVGPTPGSARRTIIELYRQTGATDRLITLYFNADGGVVIGSSDFPSEAIRPSATGADGEYEYFTTAPAAAKDRLLLALLAERYQGNENAVEDFRRWCESRGIPVSFYVH